MNWDVTAVIAGIILGAAFGFFVGEFARNNFWHALTVERGLAQYCPDTGEWAWIGECDE